MAVMTEEASRYDPHIETFASEPESPFESASEQESGWGRHWGCTNDVGRPRVVLVHRPGEEPGVVDPARFILDLDDEAVPSGGGGIHCSTASLRRDPL